MAVRACRRYVKDYLKNTDWDLVYEQGKKAPTQDHVIVGHAELIHVKKHTGRHVSTIVAYETTCILDRAKNKLFTHIEEQPDNPELKEYDLSKYKYYKSIFKRDKVVNDECFRFITDSNIIYV
jgi:hypothetical protein